MALNPSSKLNSVFLTKGGCQCSPLFVFLGAIGLFAGFAHHLKFVDFQVAMFLPGGLFLFVLLRLLLVVLGFMDASARQRDFVTDMVSQFCAAVTGQFPSLAIVAGKNEAARFLALLQTTSHTLRSLRRSLLARLCGCTLLSAGADREKGHRQNRDQPQHCSRNPVGHKSTSLCREQPSR